METITLISIYINIVVGIVNISNMDKETRLWLRWIIALVAGLNFLVAIILVTEYVKG